MKLPKPEAGDFWGGLAAMLVALPSAIAFGVIIYSPLGTSYAAQGALAGILGVTALGLIAPTLGGTNRLITAPCAPAAAVMSAFALEFMHGGGSVESALLMISMLGLLAGLLQILFGTMRLGQLIEYMPYTVVSGYLSGVGLYIIAGQVPKFLGASKDVHFWESLASPELWKWQSMVIGAVTIGAMLIAPKITRVVPAAILALLAGVLAYFGLGFIDPALLTLEGNPFVVGTFSGGGNFSDAMTGRWHIMGDVSFDQVKHILVPALTLAILLSIDTLKTCVVLDALTRSRHKSNRELIGQGCGNIASAVIGGIPGAGTMGATLVNMSSGAVTRYSGIYEGVLALIAFLILGSLISWVPVSALAAILIVIGVRMIDRHSFQFLKQRDTILDFAVIAAVVATALTVSLIAASGVGIVLAVLLFMREQIGGTIVRRKVPCSQIFSKHVRTLDEMAILVERGERGVVIELQGSLFFGTANQLYKALEPEIKTRDYIILDMRRVQSVDVTAVHMLDQIKVMLAERNGYLIFSHLPQSLPSGRDMQKYFDQVGLVRPESPVRVVGELDAALEWVENRNLKAAVYTPGEHKTLELAEFELFKGRKTETLAALESSMEKRSYKAGEKIFQRGDTGDEIYLIRSGAVRIVLPLSDRQTHHLGTFGRGSFFGEMAFLDGDVRSANAVAFSNTELYVLSRKVFDTVAENHKMLALGLMTGLARVIASRLRYTNAELRVLEL
ncbi:MAG: SulP family inorganic anion transporter [Gammaproteobacteria bacterium]|nr:SulP family inorganic anion transporter [Gammaproteobacteria bacterium]